MPIGGPVTVYIKHHLVPGFESRDRPGIGILRSQYGTVRAGTCDLQGHGFPATQPSLWQIGCSAACWCLHGTSILTAGCTGEWPSCVA